MWKCGNVERIIPLRCVFAPLRVLRETAQFENLKVWEYENVETTTDLTLRLCSVAHFA